MRGFNRLVGSVLVTAAVLMLTLGAYMPAPIPYAKLSLSNSIVTGDLTANSVTDAKLRQGVGSSVIGRASGTTGDVADIQAANTGQVLRLAGTLGFGAVDLTNANAITGDLPDVNLTSNVPLKNATGTWTAAQTFTGGVLRPVSSLKTASYTATADDWYIRVSGVSGEPTISIPAAASHTGREYRIVLENNDNNAFVDFGGDQIRMPDAAEWTSIAMSSKNATITIVSDGDFWVCTAYTGAVAGI